MKIKNGVPYTMLYLEVPKTLKNYFKAWCIRNDTTMTDEITKFMKAKMKGEQE